MKPPQMSASIALGHEPLPAVRAVKPVSLGALDVHAHVALQTELALEALVALAAHERLQFAAVGRVLSLHVLAQRRGVAEGALAKAALFAAVLVVRALVDAPVPVTAEPPPTPCFRAQVRLRVALLVPGQQMAREEERRAARLVALEATQSARQRARQSRSLRWLGVARCALVAAHRLVIFEDAIATRATDE